ncbi:MAG: DUF504 domain-containing protein [Syntrophobacteraceae bacterium]|nr:DUF504 domain-containing protein [Syntrophobacteraceae bacterium]
MIPIQQLFSRIRRDKSFGTASFEIGYLDHSANKIIRIPFTKINFEEGNQFSFQLEDETGEMAEIPFHRVREVFQDGGLIWKRDG